MDPSLKVKISKKISYILRHGAAKESIPIREDGFVKVSDLLQWKKLKGSHLTENDILSIVESDSKQRYSVTYLVNNSINSSSSSNSNNNNNNNNKSLYIRANQGHSLAVEDLSLVPITWSENIIAVHGTTKKAYESILKSEGLSKMNRNHIHMASAEFVPTESSFSNLKDLLFKINRSNSVMSGIRPSSTVLIYIDVSKAIKDGSISFYKSSNNVILSPGDNKGFIPSCFFLKVVQKNDN